MMIVRRLRRRTCPVDRLPLGSRTASVRSTRPEAMSYVEVPPCEVLVDPKPQWQQTYAVKGGKEAVAAFKAHAQGRAVDGAGMWAIHQTRDETYLIITLGKGDQRGPLEAARD